MNDLQNHIESALQAGDWDRLGQEAATWIGAVETAGERRIPVHILRLM